MVKLKKCPHAPDGKCGCGTPCRFGEMIRELSSYELEKLLIFVRARLAVLRKCG